MATQVAERFQRGLNYAIVDEVDSILIDEARTPLIISGQAEDSTDLYRRINALIPTLVQAGGREGRGRLLGGPQAAQRDALRAGPRARRGADDRRRGCCPRARASTTRPTSC